MKVAVFSAKFYEQEYLENYNQGRHYLTYFTQSLNSVTAHLASGFDVVSILTHDNVDRTTIDKLAEEGVKLIALRCAGYDNVDLSAAAGKITIVNVPAYSPQAIAEHAVALILALSRKIHKTYQKVKENNFSLQGLMGFNLYGKTVGVVGTGKIGMAFIDIMLGFGSRVIAYDLQQSVTLKAKGVSYVPFQELLERSDIVSIHCPLTPDTYHIFNSATLASMKQGAMLINTARGGVINTDDVIDALKQQHLGFLGIDVYENEAGLFFKDLSDESVIDDHMAILKSFKNVIITPHQAFFTKEAVDQIAATTIKNLNDFDKGLKLENEIEGVSANA